VAKTNELKKRYGAEEGEELSRQLWKEPSRASGLFLSESPQDGPPHLAVKRAVVTAAMAAVLLMVRIGGAGWSWRRGGRRQQRRAWGAGVAAARWMRASGERVGVGVVRDGDVEGALEVQATCRVRTGWPLLHGGCGCGGGPWILWRGDWAGGSCHRHGGFRLWDDDGAHRRCRRMSGVVALGLQVVRNNECDDGRRFDSNARGVRHHKRMIPSVRLPSMSPTPSLFKQTETAKQHQ